MARSANHELTDRFEQFYRNYYRKEIGELAQRYPNEQRSLHLDWNDLHRFDPDLADDYLAQPDQIHDYAREALRLYDLPVDVSLGQAHVRVSGLPEVTEILEIRAQDINTYVEVQGIVQKVTDVRPKIEEAAFECQRCGTLTYIPQSGGGYQEPHKCQGCERQGPFAINHDQSNFVDSQRINLMDLADVRSESPAEIEVSLEDDITRQFSIGEVATVAGIPRANQDAAEPRLYDITLHCHWISVNSPTNIFDELNINSAGFDDASTHFTENLKQFVKRSRAVLNQHEALDETSTQMKIITPFLTLLGWNIFSPQVRIEYPQDNDATSKRADYALMDSDENPLIVIEAKQEGKRLDPFFRQLREYMRILGAKWGILTNGERYVFLRTDDGLDSPSEITVLDCRLEKLLEQEEVLKDLSSHSSD